MSDESKTQDIPGWPPRVGLTVDEVAQSLRVDSKTARKLIKEQGLPAKLCGRGYRVDVDALKAWLAAGGDEGWKDEDSESEG